MKRSSPSELLETLGTHSPKWVRLAVAYSFILAVLEALEGIKEGALGSLSLRSLPRKGDYAPTIVELTQLLRDEGMKHLYESGASLPLVIGEPEQTTDQQGDRRLNAHFILMDGLQKGNIRAKAVITTYTIPKGTVGRCIELTADGVPIEPTPPNLSTSHSSEAVPTNDLPPDQEYRDVSADMWRGDEVEDSAKVGMSWTGPIPNYESSSLYCGIDCRTRFGARTPYREERLDAIDINTTDLIELCKAMFDELQYLSKAKNTPNQEVGSPAIQSPGSNGSPMNEGECQKSENIFRFDGRKWHIQYRGLPAKPIVAKNLRGAMILAVLLSHPTDYLTMKQIYNAHKSIIKDRLDPKSLSPEELKEITDSKLNVVSVTAINTNINNFLKLIDEQCPEFRHHITGLSLDGISVCERGIIGKDYEFAYMPTTVTVWDTRPIN